MVRRLIVLAFTTIVAAGCGGDTDVQDATGGATGETSAEEPVTGSTGETAEAPASGEAPDACAVISGEEIASITGADPGAGTPGGGGARTVCFYETGLITAVEVAGNYEASKAIIEDMRPIEPVSGVGNEAFWDSASQLVALGEEFFVAVTFPPGDEATLIDQGKQILTVMLGNV